MAPNGSDTVGLFEPQGFEQACCTGIVSPAWRPVADVLGATSATTAVCTTTTTTTTVYYYYDHHYLCSYVVSSSDLSAAGG